jgi:short-subunit dehydrogenase
VLESSYEDWAWVMGVNFNGVLYGVKTFLPTLIAQGEECHLVNVSSLNGVIPGEDGAASYSASKQAVVGLSESLYSEMKPHPHVHISVYLPGQVNTDITECERNYPAGLQPLDTPEKQRHIAGLRQQLQKALSPAQSAEILFAGLRADNLYIGPRGFSAQHPRLIAWIQGRAENIVKEQSPTLFSE